jgi:hypothetical protein
VMVIDADESVPDALWHEITQAIRDRDAPDGYFALKGFHFLGRRFRFGGFSHSAVLLFRYGRARYEKLPLEDSSGLDMEVHERLIIDGRIGRFAIPLVHEDLKGLDAYIERHRRYASWEAAWRNALLYGRLSQADVVAAKLFGNAQERRRFLKRIAIRVPFEPALWFLYHYVFRLGFLEGGAGFTASRIRAQYISEARANLQVLRNGQAGPSKFLEP